MGTFLFRCPNTGLKVQGWVADNPAERDDNTYESMSCAACAQLHLVNPKSGKVLGGGDED